MEKYFFPDEDKDYCCNSCEDDMVLKKVTII